MEGNPAEDPEFNPGAVLRLPVQFWTFTISNSKVSCVATRACRYRRARARSLDLGRCLGRSVQAIFTSRHFGGGPGPAAGLSRYIKPLFGLPSRHARTHATPTAPSTKRRRDGGGLGGV